jgi:hypothetical protein
MNILWFSSGCSSALTWHLARNKIDAAIYIDIQDQHPDTHRFNQDVSRWIGKPFETLRSDRYKNVEEVVLSTAYVNGPGGASCTQKLKKNVRKQWEKEHAERHRYFWGMDMRERAG